MKGQQDRRPIGDQPSGDSASYMQGAGGLIGETRGGASKYYHADALGTTRAITNSSQTKTDSLDTDAFGMSVAVTGSTPTPFGFAGQHGYQNDSVTGLMRLGHRYYDASVGRFLSRDPIQDGYNWYTYVGNDPVNKVDPHGMYAIAIAIGVVLLIAIVVIVYSPPAREAVGRLIEKIIDDNTPVEQPPAPPTDIDDKTDPGDTSTWPTPPGKPPFEEGDPSRKKPRERGERSLYDNEGGEWRPHLPDNHHDGHWNYKPPGNNQEWQDVPTK